MNSALLLGVLGLLLVLVVAVLAKTAKRGKRKIRLVDTASEGPYLKVVYSWGGELPHQLADQIDTRARQVIASKIGRAAIAASVSCSRAPNHGVRPAWYFAGCAAPISVVEGGFNTERCWATIGPILMNARVDPLFELRFAQFGTGFVKVASTLFV